MEIPLEGSSKGLVLFDDTQVNNITVKHLEDSEVESMPNSKRINEEIEWKRYNFVSEDRCVRSDLVSLLGVVKYVYEGSNLCYVDIRSFNQLVVRCLEVVDPIKNISYTVVARLDKLVEQQRLEMSYLQPRSLVVITNLRFIDSEPQPTLIIGAFTEFILNPLQSEEDYYQNDLFYSIIEKAISSIDTENPAYSLEGLNKLGQGEFTSLASINFDRLLYNINLKPHRDSKLTPKSDQILTYFKTTTSKIPLFFRLACKIVKIVPKIFQTCLSCGLNNFSDYFNRCKCRSGIPRFIPRIGLTIIAKDRSCDNLMVYWNNEGHYCKIIGFTETELYNGFCLLGHKRLLELFEDKYCAKIVQKDVELVVSISREYNNAIKLTIEDMKILNNNTATLN